MWLRLAIGAAVWLVAAFGTVALLSLLLRVPHHIDWPPRRRER